MRELQVLYNVITKVNIMKCFVQSKIQEIKLISTLPSAGISEGRYLGTPSGTRLRII